MPSKRKNLLQKINQWHYSLGATFAGLFCVVALTGLLINHSHHLSLDSKTVGWRWLAQYYGIKTIDIHQGYQFHEYWAVQVNRELYLNTQPMGDCRGALVGAQSLEGLIHFICEHSLLITLEDGQVVEHITLFPEPIQSTYIDQGQVYGIGRQSQTHYRFDEHSSQWIQQQSASKNQRIPLIATNLPPALSEALNLLGNQQTNAITWERVLLDLHSGRLFGNIGIFLVDLSGIALLFSSLSGLWMWRKKKRRQKHRK